MATPSPSDPATVSGPLSRVGFIGLGDMGGAMASRIIDAGTPTVLWARRPEALGPFAAANVDMATSPAELAATADLIGVCVWADDDVREVVSGAGGVLAGCRAGTILAIHSTVLPATCRELAAIAARRDVVVIDAPVSGGRARGLAGSLTMAVGGDDAALARCRSVFGLFASTIIRLGDVGAGQVAKLLNNALLAANLALADDVLTLGDAFGADVPGLADFLRGGTGRSYALEVARAIRSSSAARRAALPALAKDLDNLAVEMAATPGIGRLLGDVAGESIRRLRPPPSGQEQPVPGQLSLSRRSEDPT